MKPFTCFASRSNFLFLIGCATVFFAVTPAVIATPVTVTLTSSDFSFGFGASDGSGYPVAWTTNETSGANTPTTQGSFSFTPSVSGGYNSGHGPLFPGRILTDSEGTVSGDPSLFTNTITAAWLGGVPSDTVTEVPPNFRLRLNITSIRIYGQPFNAPSGTLGFVEITPGYGTNSPLTTLGPGSYPTGWDTASMYTHVIWDPVDYEVTGTNFSRTFALAYNDFHALDGFEVFGNVQLLYDVPEPSAVVLALAGIGFVVIRRRTIR